jgi:hypothetical protein
MTRDEALRRADECRRASIRAVYNTPYEDRWPRTAIQNEVIADALQKAWEDGYAARTTRSQAPGT